MAAMEFTDRSEAGRRLAARLEQSDVLPESGSDVVVLGLPRGGVPVAAEVARSLQAPLDVILVRKLGMPAQPELAMGALGEDGVEILNEDLIQRARISDRQLDEVRARESAELERRARRYRGDRPRVPLEGRTAVIVDDGVATGATARAACQVARAHGAGRVVLAVPVAPRGWESTIGDAADALVCVLEPYDFFGIGQFYWDFSQTSDEEVLGCLAPRSEGPRSG